MNPSTPQPETIFKGRLRSTILATVMESIDFPGTEGPLGDPLGEPSGAYTDFNAIKHAIEEDFAKDAARRWIASEGFVASETPPPGAEAMGIQERKSVHNYALLREAAGDNRALWFGLQSLLMQGLPLASTSALATDLMNETGLAWGITEDSASESYVLKKVDAAPGESQFVIESKVTGTLQSADPVLRFGASPFETSLALGLRVDVDGNMHLSVIKPVTYSYTLNPSLAEWLE